MKSKADFVDYYDLMQISPKAELETIKRVYKLLVSRLHPDNTVTGDAEKFLLLRRAFETLSDPQRRSAFDQERHAQERKALPPPIDPAEFAKGVDVELGRRVAILTLLYRQRQTDPDRQGLSLLELEQMIKCPSESVTFTTWYLQNKNYLGSADNSDFVITPAGIDYLEANLPASQPVVNELLELPGRR
jgi:curved DNA-binding protein